MNFNGILCGLITKSSLSLEDKSKILLYIDDLEEKVKNLDEKETLLNTKEQELEEKINLFQKEIQAYKFYVATLEKIVDLNKNNIDK